MKRIPLILLIMILTSSVVLAKGYEAKKKAGPYEVSVMMDRNPPVMGNNTIAIAIKDIAGKAVTNAKVSMEYGMPAMPGMPPMNYKASAKLKGDIYAGTVNFSMTGPWFLKIKIRQKGAKSETVNLNIDIR